MSVLAVLAQPREYNGRDVWVVGYLGRDARHLFLGPVYEEKAIEAFAVALSSWDCSGKGLRRSPVSGEHAARLARSFVAVRGFVAIGYGGESSSPVGLCDVREMRGVEHVRPEPNPELDALKKPLPQRLPPFGPDGGS